MTRKWLPWIQWLILNIRNVALHRFYVTSLLFNKSDTEVLYCTQWHSSSSSTGQGYLVLKILMADDGNRLGTSRIFLGVEDPMQHGRGVALADFNRDGKTDIVYGNWNGPHRLYMQLSNRKQKFKVGPDLMLSAQLASNRHDCQIPYKDLLQMITYDKWKHGHSHISTHSTPHVICWGKCAQKLQCLWFHCNNRLNNMILLSEGPKKPIQIVTVNSREFQREVVVLLSNEQGAQIKQIRPVITVNQRTINPNGWRVN